MLQLAFSDLYHLVVIIKKHIETRVDSILLLLELFLFCIWLSIFLMELLRVILYLLIDILSKSDSFLDGICFLFNLDVKIMPHRASLLVNR